MPIAIDQTRLRRISSELLAGETLDRTRALALLEIAQLASGMAPDIDPEEHATLQAVVQHVASLAGLEVEEVSAIEAPIHRAWFATLGKRLATRGARELAYALALLVALSDLELAAGETAGLEELQRALSVTDRRAIDLTILVVRHVDSTRWPGDTVAPM